MNTDKRKIVKLLQKKGLITKRDSDSLNRLLALATEENKRKSEKSKKKVIELLYSQKTITKKQFLNLLAERL